MGSVTARLRALMHLGYSPGRSSVASMPVRDVVWTPHYRVSWGGTLGQANEEIWSNTVRFRSDQDVFGQGGPVLGHDQLQTVANAMVPILQGWMGDGFASAISAIAKFAWVKVNWVNSEGLQPDQNTVLAESTPPRNGSSGNPLAAWHLTYALTLRTALARGRSHSGRIYPPVPTIMVDNGSPYCSLANATGMATAFARVLYAMEQAFDDAAPINDPNVHAIVASPGKPSTGKPALFQRITGVVCDRVPDVMHSRTNAIPRSEGPTVAPGP